MEVYLDDELIARTPVDLATVAASRGHAFIGFTASTGAGFENHDILTWAFETTDIGAAMGL